MYAPKGRSWHWFLKDKSREIAKLRHIRVKVKEMESCTYVEEKVWQMLVFPFSYVYKYIFNFLIKYLL